MAQSVKATTQSVKTKKLKCYSNYFGFILEVGCIEQILLEDYSVMALWHFYKSNKSIEK
jgi:hypothetical protein